MSRASVYEFERLKEEHFDLLFRWLNEPHVAERWGGEITRKHFEEEYRPHLASSSVFRFIVHLKETPIGFIQYYLVQENTDAWWPNQPAGTVGIDQYIGDANYLDQGHGSAFIREFVTQLLAMDGVKRVITDPAPSNLRAIRCYEKVGFNQAGPMNTPDGPAILMVKFR